MPVEQAPSRKAPQPRSDATVVRYHDYIDEKIESTRRAVKVVDLATALVELAVSVLLFLLMAVVIEHWFVPGGFPLFVRATLFAVLVVGAGYFAYQRLWPLCIRAINPVYAAQTIEHSTPTLKNGLINLLLFRQHRQEIPDAVYRTLEEQAAHGLTRAPVDTAVDRTELIRLGYVLIAIVAVGALYKVFSPKDPFVAVERVLMPWADIVPASRVTISEVTPGSVTISRGEYLDVSAEVRGLSEEDTVVLRYTTEDGQIVDRTIPLQRNADGLQYTGRLADDSATNSASAGAGITRNLKYRLEAGDARTRNYTVQVVPAASILVERIDYHYPPYTGFVDNSVDGVGDIRAIEGTRVTIHARANGPIREANVDFEADGRPDLKMTSTDQQAQAAFDLALRDDRQTPTHASYVLRFTNDEGRTNRIPVKHSINVEPDLMPEAEIRQPREKLRDVRLDEQVTIEVEARDPDFALQAVRLRGQVMGSDAVNELLLKSEQRGRFNGRFMLLPSAHGLKAGDVLEYWAEADDNRTPKANTVATEHKTLRIVSPNPAQQPPPDQVAKNDRQLPQNQPPQQGDQQRGGEQQQGKQQPQNGSQEQGQQNGEAGKQQQGDKNANGQQGKDSQGQQNKGDSKGSADGAYDKQAGSDQKQGGQDQKSQNDLNKDQKESGQQQKGNQGKDGQKQTDGKSAANDSAAEPAGKSQGEKEQQDKQTGAGAAGGESSQDGAQPRGARPANSQGQPGANNQQEEGQQQNGSPQKGDQKPQAGEKESPVSSQGDNDAEAFERIQKRLEKTGELKREEGGKERGGEGEKGRGGDEQRQGDKETGKQGEKKPGESASADGERKKNAGDKSSQGEKGEQKSNSRSEDKGTDARNDDLKQQDRAKSEKPAQQQKSPGGEQTSSKGSPSGGDEQKNQGAPNSQQGMKPTEKPNQAESKGGQSNQQEPPAGANSKRESDSHGDQGGDKAGGGEEGGGQKSPHDGTGSAGANQSADKGAGQSGEKGRGENSAEAGKDAKSQERTGAGDGKTAGKGSEQRDGAGKERGGEGEKGRQGDKETRRQGDKETEKQESKQPGESAPAEGKAIEKKPGAPQDASKTKDQQNGDAKNQKGPAGPSENFGQPNGAFNPQPSITGEAPKGDDANLEYARKQTDLVLDKLADQMKKKRVDEGLLKDLGWSEADLKKFIERWQQRKAAAEKNDEAGETARRELDDALRSLGLRRGELEQNAVRKDTLRDLREGYRGPVPTEYKDRLRAYNQGVSRARQSGE